MSVDDGTRTRQPRAADLWRLPEVRDVRIRWRRFEPPRRVTSEGVDRAVKEAIEIELVLSSRFAIRALGPVLWVGDEALALAEGDGENVYRFFTFEPESLRPGAPIALAWNSPGARRHPTEYRYDPPSETERSGEPELVLD
jgi:hypothetical protein